MVKRFNQFKMLPKELKWRVIERYALFQVPGMAILVFILILLHWWVDLPLPLTWGLIFLWLVKDIFMFPFMWHAYDRTPSRYAQSLIGTEGITEERLAPSGYIRVRGELWHAEMMGKKTPVEKGETVVVEGAYGLTLFVQPTHKKLKRNDSPWVKELPLAFLPFVRVGRIATLYQKDHLSSQKKDGRGVINPEEEDG